MSLARTPRDHDWDAPRRWSALGVILALHAIALGALLQLDSVRAAVTEVAPIMVGLITVAPPAPPAPPPPQPAPPTPTSVKPKPKPIVMAAPTPDPLPVAAPEPEPILIEQPVSEASSLAPPQPAPADMSVIPPSFVAAYLDNPPPLYPASSKRLGESGLVMLRVHVSAQGVPESIEIERSCGYARLDRAALDAVRKWRFVPATQGEQAVPATVLVPLNFELKNT